MTLLLLLFSLTTLYDRLLPSVVRLDNAEGPICSAVAVKAPDASLLTARHCVDGQDALYINGREVVVVRRAHRDLAMLEWQPVFDFAAPRLRAVPVAKQTPAPGTPVAVIGYPYGDVPVIFAGTLASATAADDMVWIDAHAVGGMSGGAVLGRDGRLITVVKGVVRGILIAESPASVRQFVGGR